MNKPKLILHNIFAEFTEKLGELVGPCMINFEWDDKNGKQKAFSVFHPFESVSGYNIPCKETKTSFCLDNRYSFDLLDGLDFPCEYIHRTTLPKNKEGTETDSLPDRIDAKNEKIDQLMDAISYLRKENAQLKLEAQTQKIINQLLFP